MVTLSASTARVGETITVQGSGFGPNSATTVDFHSQTVMVGSATTDASGNFKVAIVVPNVAPGAHTITVTAASGLSASAAITVIGASVGTSGTSSGLAFTGFQTILIGGLALLLILGGQGMLLANRRRRAS